MLAPISSLLNLTFLQVNRRWSFSNTVSALSLVSREVKVTDIPRELIACITTQVMFLACSLESLHPSVTLLRLLKVSLLLSELTLSWPQGLHRKAFPWLYPSRQALYMQQKHWLWLLPTLFPLMQCSAHSYLGKSNPK